MKWEMNFRMRIRKLSVVVSLGLVLAVPQAFGDINASILPLGHRIPETAKESFLSDTYQGQVSRFKMYGQRYKRANATANVFAHGFLNTYWMVDPWAQASWMMGYDTYMFNHVHFGLDGERSYTEPYQKGDYDMSGMIRGMDQVIDMAVKQSGGPINYIGFSLGGMTIYEYLSGMVGVKPDGNPIRDPKVAEARRKKIRAIVTIAAPPYSLKGMSLPSRLAAMVGHRVLNTFDRIQGVVPMGLGGHRELHKGNPAMIGRIIDLIPNFMGKWAIDMMIADVGNRKNFGYWKNNLGPMIRTMFSDPHTEILANLGTIANKLDRSPTADIGHIPNLIIMGTDDGLANKDALVHELKERMAHDYDESAVIVEGFSHLDLMLDPAIYQRGLGQLVEAYLEDPQAFVYDFGRVNMYRTKEQLETHLLRHTYSTLERRSEKLKERKQTGIIQPYCESVLHW